MMSAVEFTPVDADELTPELRVEMGIAVLDGSDFVNWREDLLENIDRLNVADPSHCPLAILFGSWKRGIDMLGLVMGNTAMYGFANGDDTQAWKDYLNAL